MNAAARRRFGVGILAIASAGAALAVYLATSGPDPAPSEHTGAFDLGEEGIAVFAARDDGCLRAVLSDGQVGKVCPDGAGAYVGGSYFSGAGPASIRVTFEADTVRVEWDDAFDGTGSRRADIRTRSSFPGREGTQLLGELVAPVGDGPFPLLVHIGGSERSGSVGRVWLPYMLAAQGIASFVYDKRGVGGSDGEYTQDFQVLGADAAAAVTAARAALGKRLDWLGVIGFSQGGWVGPIAATQVDVDGVLVGFGLAVSPTDEEISEVRARVIAAGHDVATVDRAAEFAAASVRVADSDFADGLDQLEALKSEAEADGWLSAIGSDGISGALASNPVFFVRLLWGFFDADTSWRFAPADTLRSLNVPQLWLLGGQDRDAPSAQTQHILGELAASGLDVQLRVFPTADHGLIERVGGPDGPAARYVDGYAQAIAEFVRAKSTAEASSLSAGQ
ncbi:MAG: alpha/beta hydrolase [Myxococcota bacterium]